MLLVLLYFFIIIYYAAAFGMSVALSIHYPEHAGWLNVSRSMGWPVTLYEIEHGLID